MPIALIQEIGSDRIVPVKELVVLKQHLDKFKALPFARLEKVEAVTFAESLARCEGWEVE